MQADMGGRGTFDDRGGMGVSEMAKKRLTS
jgi:hypothetical protein